MADALAPPHFPPPLSLSRPRRPSLWLLPVRPFGWLLAYTGRHPTLMLSILAALLSLGWGGWSIWKGEHAMHSPGPVAMPHANLDCTVCHTQAWQPLQRLVAEDHRQARLAMDAACVVCHAKLVHHNEEIAGDVPNCVSCHREHQGQHGLSVVADSSCTGCHASLRTIDGPSRRFERSVTALASHPEFGILRRGEPDPGVLLFNHAAHLKAEGIRDAKDHQVSLKCADCHQPTPDGRYLEPIRFEAHCASCHASALVYDTERFRTQPAPHGHQPTLLRGLLRERYTDYIHEHPRELGSKVTLDRPLPGQSGLRKVTKQEWTWVHQRLEEAERLLFQSAGGCQYCHRVETTAKGWHVTPPALPKRWLTHSKFSHFSHRLDPKPVDGQENCTVCHANARSSTLTADVLIPSIQSCRTCHLEPNQPHSGRSDCMECHTYHHEIGGRGKVD